MTASSVVSNESGLHFQSSFFFNSHYSLATRIKNIKGGLNDELIIIQNLEQLFLPSQSNENQYCAHTILLYMDVVIRLSKSSGGFISIGKQRM